jgi:CelD/BcsL family acetyltransferase involved in cellulose biosynthesis
VTVEIHREIAPLADAWDDLAGRVRTSPFLRPGWIEPWWRAFGTGELNIVALRRGTALAAVVPLAHRLGALSSVTNWHTPEFGLLAQDERALAELAGAVIARAPRCLSLRFVPRESGDPEAFRAAAESAGYRVLVRTLERSPYVETHGERAPYDRTLDRKFLKELGRQRRRLEKLGAVSYSVETTTDLLDECFRLEALGWKGTGGTAIASHPETIRFYTEVARWAAARGTLRLAFLRLDGRPIACELMLEEGRTLYSLKAGFDDAYRRYGPGQLIVQDILEEAFRRRLATYEFLGADEPVKLRWTDRTRERLSLQAFAPTATGIVEWAAYRYGRPAAKRALALARR